MKSKFDVFWIPVLCFLGGVLFLDSYSQYYLGFQLGLGFTLILLGVGIWIYHWNDKILWWVCGLIFFFLGGLFGRNHSGISEENIALVKPTEIRLSGYITEVKWGEEKGKGYLQGRMRVKEKSINDITTVSEGEISFWLNSIDFPTGELWHAGQGVQLKGELRIREQYLNPGPWLIWQEKSGRGVFRAFRGTGAESIEWEPKYDQKLVGWAAELRTFFLKKMEKVMPEKDVFLLQGLLFGGQEGIDPLTRKQFSTTGLTHILSVSGTHLATLFAGILWVGRLLKIRQVWISLFGAGILIFYSFLCGFPPPVIRSLWMALGVVIALATDRERSSQRIFSLTVLGMMIYEPRWIYDISFQLSVAATTGLVFAIPYLEQTRGWQRFWKGPLLFTLLSQGLSLPFLATYFQQLSLVSVFSNLILVPIFQGILILGLLGSLFSGIVIKVGEFFWIVSSLLLGFGLMGIRFFSSFSWSILPISTMGFWSGVVYYVGVILLFLGFQVSAKRKKIWAVSLAGLLLIGLFIGLAHPTQPNRLEIHVIDVGQGDSILIRTPKGKSMLIDGGGIPYNQSSFDIGERVVAPYLWSEGIRELELIIISHGDEDHSGGIEAVLARFPTQQIWMPEQGMEKFSKWQGKISTPPVGTLFEVDGVKIRVLAQPPKEKKSYSQVIEVTYGEKSFLFTGDMEGKEEEEFLKVTDLQTISGLKVGHHGARKSSNDLFLNRIKPEFSFISVGESNSYGHPALQTLVRLNSGDKKIYRTDLQGRILIKTDGKTIQVETMKGQGNSK